MPVIPLPVANGFYVSDSLPLSAQECTNLYPSIQEAPALNQEVLLGTPGIRQLATTGQINQINRGAHVLGDILYFVNGTTLWRLNRTVTAGVASYSVEAVGTVPGVGRVSMADNGTQLCILVPGTTSTGYIFTADPDTLTTITDPDFKANGEPQHVVFIDGYFAFTTDTKKFIVSALNDGLSYNALDFGSAEADPDITVAPIVFNNQLFVAGTETIEGYQNIGGAEFPFQRTGLYIPKGVSAPFSIVNTSSTFMWVGGGKNESPSIWALAGNNAEKVSTIPIDTILHRLTPDELSSVFAYAYAQRGAFFVCFVLPNTVLCYDLTSRRWHERKSRIVSSNGSVQTIRFRANSLVSAYGINIVGDSVDGRIGELDADTYTEYGNPIIRRFATQPFHAQGASFCLPSIELTVESGVGNIDQKEPEIRMERSTDGKTWSDARPRKIGSVGQYDKRAIWRRNGRAARFEVLRFSMSDPVKFVIIGLYADVMTG